MAPRRVIFQMHEQSTPNLKRGLLLFLAVFGTAAAIGEAIHLAQPQPIPAPPTVISQVLPQVQSQPLVIDPNGRTPGAIDPNGNGNIIEPNGH